MPEYDATKVPSPLLAPDLSGGEVGRGPAEIPAWHPSAHVPDQYAGPPASREYEVAGRQVKRDVPIPAVTPPTESKGEPSTSPPPGHLAEPKS